ncbi:MAG: nuclear transport factor 2 family protein [Proteobacteria bacterium]|nr:nuclear transport factor 2 family protein [Pseudomonadota bacterium]
MTTPLETVQKAYAAFGRGDIQALLAMCSPNVHWQFVADRTAPYNSAMVGTSRVGEWFASVAASDDIHAFEPQQMFAGAGHVTVIGHERTTLRATGKTFECPWVHVFAVDSGVITAFWGMLDTQTAGEARVN